MYSKVRALTICIEVSLYTGETALANLPPYREFASNNNAFVSVVGTSSITENQRRPTFLPWSGVRTIVVNLRLNIYF